MSVSTRARTRPQTKGQGDGLGLQWTRRGWWPNEAATGARVRTDPERVGQRKLAMWHGIVGRSLRVVRTRCIVEFAGGSPRQATPLRAVRSPNGSDETMATHAEFAPLLLDPRVLLAAFQHALRAHTEIVGVVGDALIRYRQDLEHDWRNRILQDIEMALARGEADERWRDVAEAMR